MKPPSIWPRSIAGLSDAPTSCRMSTAQQPVLAGQRVDRDLGHRRAVGEVEERPAGQRRAVVVDLRRRVEARRRQLHARVVRGVDELGERERGARRRARSPPANATSSGAQSNLRAANAARRSRSVARRGARRHAVDVAARRCGRRRRVRHLARVGRRYAHRVERHAELLRDDLLHLGEQALAHLGAAVVQQHRAVAVDVDQRAGLVVMRRGERDAELDRRQRDAALDDRAGAIPRGDRLRAARGSRARASSSSISSGAMLSSTVMPYGRDVALGLAVEVAPCARRADRSAARARCRR